MPTPNGEITTSTIWTQGEPDAVDNTTTDEVQEEQVQEAENISEQTLG